MKLIEKPGYEAKQSSKFKAPMVEHPSIVPQRSFDEYKDRYEPVFFLDRTEDGILTAKWHTMGEEMKYGIGMHRSLGQLFQDVGQDADTEVLILGGYGSTYLKGGYPNMIAERENMTWYSYEHMYQDGTTFIEGLINLRIPTIGIINGNASHSEIALFCDITLMAEGAELYDPHFCMGGVPGDGIQIALQGAMGIKRANYAMYTNQHITAEKAMEIGLVNEIMPREKLYERAMEIAQYIMTKHRTTRRIMSEICKDPWREMIGKTLRPNFGREMWTFFTNPELDHESGHKAMMAWEETFGKKGI